jgi:signal transduction histidine kinase/ActR/RegA family two-component response regulator
MSQRPLLSNMQDWSAGDVRRWVIGGVAIQLVGYLLIGSVATWQYGLQSDATPRLFIAAAVCAVALALVLRNEYRAGILLAMAATWAEAELRFVVMPDTIGPGLAVLPVLVMGFTLLEGGRAGLVATIVTVIASVTLHRLNPHGREAGFTPQLTYWLTLHAIGMFAGWAIIALTLEGFNRMFDRLRLQQQDLVDTIRFAPDGMLVVDAAQRVIIANPSAEAILRTTTPRIVGRALADVFAEASGEPDRLAPVPPDTGETPVGLDWIARDGTALHVEVTSRLMEGGRREVLLRDVSERRRLEDERQAVAAQAAQSQRLEAVGQLAGGLSHDFNNILTSVGGLAELLREESDPAVRAALADELAATRERGAVLTRQLLAFANRDVVQPHVLDLAAFVAALEPRLRARLGPERSLVIVATPGCWVRADEGQIAQAVENLVANASDAMPTGGRCTVSVERYAGTVGVPQVRLRVADTGVGMSAAVVERAFEPFYTTKGRGQGTGLGLTVVHALVRQAGGVARIHSVEGSGTRVEIDVPLVAAPPVPVTPPRARATQVSGRTILLAEDDEGTRSTVARLLRHAGYTVIEARDGTEGLHLAMTTRDTIHLLLTDVMMPGLTGPALAERVRAVHETLPVLFMTGYAEQDVAAHLGSVQTGRELIAKPFAPRELLERVERLLLTSEAAGAPKA